MRFDMKNEKRLLARKIREEEGLSLKKIADRINVAKSTVSLWVRDIELSFTQKEKLSKKGKPRPNYSEKEQLPSNMKRCTKCLEIKDRSNFYGKKLQSFCKDCAKTIAKERIKGFKDKCLTYKGTKCSKCGYNKCKAALEFHHVDGSEKDFTISNVRTRNFDSVKKELDKCILICSNCHKELHYPND